MKIQKLCLLLALPLMLVSCQPENTDDPEKPNGDDPVIDTPVVTDGVKDGIRVAYSAESTGNIIRSEVNVKDGKIAKVNFHEFQIGASNIGATSATEGDVLSVDGKNYAAHLSVFGKVYTAETKTVDEKTSVVYKHGAEDLDEFLNSQSSQEQLADLYYAYVNNFIFSCDENGEPNGLIHLYDKASADSTYWVQGGWVKLGWKANIKAIEDSLLGKDPNEVKTAKGEDKIWTVDGVATGATINNFDPYVNAAKAAFNGESNITVSFGRDMIEGREKNGHQSCFVKAEVIFNEGKVQKAYINETDQFLSLAATLTAEQLELVGENNYLDLVTPAKNEGDPDTHTYYAKTLKVGEDTVTGSLDVTAELTAAKEKVNFQKDGKVALEYYGSTAELAQDYYNAAFLHNISVVGKDGEIAAKRGNKTATKAERDNGYWNITNGSKETINNSRWKWNIDKLEKGLVGVDFSKEVALARNDAKELTLNGVTTGATMTEGETLIQFIQTAYSYLAK